MILNWRLLFLIGSIFPITCLAQYSIVPAPKSMTIGKGSFILNEETQIFSNSNAGSEARYFADWFGSATGKAKSVNVDGTLPSENFIFFNCLQSDGFDSGKGTDLSWLPVNTDKDIHYNNDLEGYKITISSRFIGVTAMTPQGIFYGIQTLRQLFPASAENGGLVLPHSLDEVVISDKPQFRHRGLLLDCCRHFMSKEFVKQTIDLIAQYKMNILHWHLTEDQGWRIQIDAYPQLTEIGAWRIEEDGSKYGGFYTKDDIREIVAYASARHITIIPEIELPGHSVAAIASYPELSCTGEQIPVENEWGVFKDIYCAGNNNTFQFLENVLTEVCELFPGKYIHIGGDEAPKFRWENCSRCKLRMEEEGLKDAFQLQTWFIERIAHFLETKNKSIIGWDEILEGGIPSSAAVQSWRGMEGGKKAAREGHLVVMSPTSHCYFDYPLTSIDLEKVYFFDPIPDSLNEKEKAYIMGGECNMWTEHAPQEQVWGKIFPRLMALSEVLWTYPVKRDFQDFQNRMEHQYNRMDVLKVDYGFPGQPFVLQRALDPAGVIRIHLEALGNSTFNYSLNDFSGDAKTISAEKNKHQADIVIESSTILKVESTWRGKQFDQSFERTFIPHKGLKGDIQLGYTPSPYYNAGGANALKDGVLGTGSFRDGIWQAVAGTNMEVVIDLGSATEISHLRSHWFHYGNAWIFRPSRVEYWTSDDGAEWQLLGTVDATLGEKAHGEVIMASDLKFEKVKKRFVKMVAHNNGPCPSWHDAAGEPSWLFCDELIIE